MAIRRLNRGMFGTALLLVTCLCIGSALAHEGHGGHGAAPRSASPRRSSGSAEKPYAAEPQKPAPIHGGQLAKGQRQHFEVVYLPRETRVYLYGDGFQPVSARGASGQVLMQVRGNPQVYGNPLRYAAQPPGSSEHDYLVADVDVTQIRDGDMQVTFDLVGLPAAEERNVRFAQTFALTRAAAVVTVVPLTPADREGIARQRICPVMEAGFDHGDPIKLMIGNQVLYVCCQDCVAAVKKDPQGYLQKVARMATPSAAQAAAPARVVATRAGDQDRAAIQAQGLCPVMNKPLGAHGVPWKVSLGASELFVCCAGCIRKVEQDPQRYLARAQELKGGR